MKSRYIGIILLAILLAPPFVYVNMNRVDQNQIKERMAQKLANMILKEIKHEVHISKGNGKTIAYGKIVLKPEPLENRKKLSIHAGSSAQIYIGYEVVSYSSPPSDPGSGYNTIYGIVGTYILTDSGQYVFKPLPFVKVELWDSDTTGDDLEGTAYTDENGYFQITADTGDEAGTSGLDVYLKIFLESPSGSYPADIRRSGTVYYAVMPTDVSQDRLFGDGIPEGEALSVYLDNDNGDDDYDGGGPGTEDKWVYNQDYQIVRYVLEENHHVRNMDAIPYTIPDPDPAGAAMLLWYIYKAYNFAKTNMNISAEDLDKVVIEFSDTISSTRYNGDENNPVIYVSGSNTGKDWEDMSLVLKEYAKYLLDKFTDIPVDEVLSNNFAWSAHKSELIAFVEGFGAFFASVVKKYAQLPSPYLYDDYPNIYNLEQQYNDDGSLGDEDVCGAVAGILWDLYDTTNDDQDGDGIGDSYSIPFSWIWNTIRNNNPNSIIDFYNGLSASYSVNKTKCWEIYWEHGVNLDNTPPSAPSITDYNPSPLNTWHQTSTITVYWKPSSDDMSGIDYYKVELHKDYSLYRTDTTSSSDADYTWSNLTSGKYTVYVYAYDRAGNSSYSSVGEFWLDTTAPSYSGASPTGTIYDSKSDAIVLTITWTDAHSGVKNVYFTYKYSSESSYRDWMAPSDSFGNTYYFNIPVSEWKQHIGETLYWKSYAVDNVGNARYSVEYSINLVDDDTEGPDISSVTTSGDIYDSDPAYYITATITDPSGVSKVTFYWKFEGGSWTWYDGKNISNDQYQIQIPKSDWENSNLWQGKTSLTIYYYIVAVDNDNDRTGDTSTSYYGSSSAPKLAGRIVDDDTDPPSVSPSSSTTGNILDSYSGDYKIAVTVTDASGVAEVRIYWSFDNATWNEDIADNVSDVWYIYIPRTTWSQASEWQNSDTLTIYYYVWAIDNDKDRVYDQSEITTNPKVAGTISDDDTNPPSISPSTSGTMYDNQKKPFYINATITDESPLAEVIFEWSFDNVNWNQQTPNNNGDLYWISIDWSVWSQPSVWGDKDYIVIYYKIRATDGDNDRIYDSLSSSVGPSEAGRIYDDDPNPPSITNITTSGIIYDNYTGPFYINVTLSDASGIYNVTFYWRFNNLSWIQQAPTGNIGNTYYLAIDESLWESTSAWEGNAYITIYYYIITYDNDRDRGYADQECRQTSVTEAGKIYDDDTNAPSIQKIDTTGNIYDNYDGPFYINATVTDDTGVYNVTIKWSFDNNTWNSWKANNTGSLYWIEISKSLWASNSVWQGRTEIVIYYQIIAYDSDMDRPHDQLRSETGIGEAGRIRDDDTDAPQIAKVVTSGVIYDNHTGPFYINFTISESSGLAAVYVYWGFDPSVPYKYNASYDPVSLYWYITIDRGLWSSTSAWEGNTYITIYYKIEARDADNDRPYDDMTTITDVNIAGEIHDDDTEPPLIENIITSGTMYDNDTSPFVIKINFSDDSGIKNATIYYSFDNSTWYFMDALKSGTICWIEIPKEIWANTNAWVGSTYITIYFYVKAYDNDMDRGEKDVLGMTSTVGEAGKIYDDDTDAPAILSVRYTGNETGYIYDDSRADVYINATITDDSGLDNVTIRWKFNDGEWNDWVAQNDSGVYYIRISYDLWSQSPTGIRAI